jgi:hypothetical protein
MQITFQSHTLERQIGLSDLPKLTRDQLRYLHAELVMAVQSMDEKMTEQQAQEVPADKDWLHRVRKKRRICVAFASQVKQAMSDSAVEKIYRLRLDEMLSQELGEVLWSEFKREALDFALERVEASDHPQAVLDA